METRRRSGLHGGEPKLPDVRPATTANQVKLLQLPDGQCLLRSLEPAPRSWRPRRPPEHSGGRCPLRPRHPGLLLGRQSQGPTEQVPLSELDPEVAEQGMLLFGFNAFSHD